jgi:formylmethanofuran dehydrogenase subunit E
MKERIRLKEAVKFHGHLGPYLVLGLLAGETALRRLQAKKYFGLEVKVWGAGHKPKSCLIDGLQLSTGATYGKGNIKKFPAAKIKISCRGAGNNRKVFLTLRQDLINRLNALKKHSDSEKLARTIFKTDPVKLFNLKTGEQ